MRYELSLDNGGLSSVRDISIVRVEGSPALQLERVGVERRSECIVPEGRRTCDPPLSPLGDFRISKGSGREPITLELRQGRVCPPGLATLDAVWVRYTLLGTRQEQRIPLQRPPAVRCP
jgi:hypothetical protein